MGIKQYISDTASEMKHVNWPTRKQTFVFTGLVILVSVVVAIFLGIFDGIFAQILKSTLLGM